MFAYTFIISLILCPLVWAADLPFENYYGVTLTSSDVRLESGGHGVYSDITPVACGTTGPPWCAMEIQSYGCYEFLLENTAYTASVSAGCTSISLVTKRNGVDYGIARSLNLGTTSTPVATSFGSGTIIGTAGEFNANDKITLWVRPYSDACDGAAVTFAQNNRLHLGFLFIGDSSNGC